MTNQAILTKAIQKAVKNGWTPFEYGTPTRVEQWQGDHMVNIAVVFPLHEDAVDWVRELEGIIFNHDFAKALWGTKRTCLNCGAQQFMSRETTCIGCLEPNPADAWQYYLQQMVIADDPIAYLGEHLDD